LPSASKPGLFAPKGEKALYKAIRDQLAPAAIAHVGDEFPEYKTLAYGIGGLLMLNADVEQDAQTVLRMLRTGFDSDEDPAGHPFTKKYLSTYFNLLVAPGVTVHLPFNRDALGLALGEIYQLTGEPSKAIEIVEQLEPTTYSAVSLAELYTQEGRYDEVIALTEGLNNQDDATALLLVFRGVAFREQGFLDAAHESFKEALRARSREPVIRHHALFERAQNYRAQGKNGMARKDLERILAENSDYDGVRDQLSELGR
jgi:tetratricopeptide (TPR) repeat protein